MSISREIWPSRSQWNEFPITYDWTDVVLEFTVTMVTRSLSLNVIPDGRMERLQMIDALYQKGLNSVEIASQLNERGVRTPSGKAYYPKLVWVTQNKFKRRTARKLGIEPQIGKLTFNLIL